MMVFANVSLWSIKMAMTNSLITPFVFAIAMCIFLGMMDLSSQLSNPFGSDDVDFPGYTWLEEFLDRAFKLMETDTPGCADSWERIVLEEELRTAYNDAPLGSPQSQANASDQSAGSGDTSSKPLLNS